MRTIERDIRTRTIILAIAILATDGVAWGQESPQVAPAPPPATAENPTGNLTPAAFPPATAPTALAAADQAFLQKAVELHATGVELAKLTEKNAGTEEVQALGQELLAEHTRSIAALREIARTKSFEITPSPTATQQATVSEFAGKLGQSFDDSYRAQAMSHHEQAIHVFADAARAAKDPDVRNFAERSLGDMKERHAAMGGAAVQLKGEIALKLPKPAQTPVAAAATAKAGKGKKGSKTKATAAAAAAAAAAAGGAGAGAGAATADAGEAANPLPTGTRSKRGATSSAPAAASTTPVVSELVATPATRNATASTDVVATRANLPKVTAASTSEEYTESDSDVRVYNPTGPAPRNGQATSNRTRETRLEPLIAGESSGVSPKPASNAVAARSTDERAQSSVPADVATEGAARTSRTRANNRSSRMTTGQEFVADPEASAAPVPRVVVQPRRTLRAATAEVAPVESAPRVIIQQAPPRRTFRIFDGDNDD